MPAKLILLLCLILSIAIIGSAQEITTIEPGRPVERALSSDGSHSYQFELKADQFLYLTVDQKGIDVVVDLFAPDGTKIMEVDSPNGDQGIEPVSFISTVAGKYRVAVFSTDKEAKPGHYIINIEQLREVRQQDRDRLTADKDLAEAEQLRKQS